MAARKPPPKAGGSGRGAGGPTLGQATGGRPGRVNAAPAAPKSLGLGLGLGAKQRAGFQQAAQGGSSSQWLAAHPGVQQKIGQINPNAARGGMQQTRIQNFMGTGQGQKPPQPPTTQRQPRGATGLGPQPQAPLQMPNYGVNQGMQSVLQSRASQGQQMDPGYGGQGQSTQPYGGGGGYQNMGQAGLAMSGGNMAWNNPQNPNSGYRPQYGGGQQGGQNYGYSNPNYNSGGQQGGMNPSQMTGWTGAGQAQQLRQSGQQDPYGYGQGGGGYQGTQQGAVAGYGGREQGAGWQGYGGGQSTGGQNPYWMQGRGPSGQQSPANLPGGQPSTPGGSLYNQGYL